MCASISEALWEQEAAANELNCLFLSAEISSNIPTCLKKYNTDEREQMGQQKNMIWAWLLCASAGAVHSNRSLWKDDEVQGWRSVKVKDGIVYSHLLHLMYSYCFKT